MGDRYDIVLRCAYCDWVNDVWYAPTCGAEMFRCGYTICNKENFVTSEIKSKKVEDVTYEEVEEGFLMATSMSWSEEDIKRMCQERFEDIIKLNKNE